MNVPANAKGADVTYIWKGEDEENQSFISFGQYDEDAEVDSFGVDDEQIFFYCSHEAFPSLIGKDTSTEDFYVTEYSFILGA